jgi:anti-sigma-K factor RskA
MSNDLHTLSGAYALDALSAEEAEEFARHLDQCPACRDEVRELRAAAARIAEIESVAPPAALKARVLAAADRTRQLPPRVTPIEVARRRRWLPRLGAAAAAVVLLVGAAVGICRITGHDEHPHPNVSVAQVFEAADAHTQTVSTRNGGRLRVATSADAGRMAIATKALPALKGKSYQAWTIRNGKATSAGVIDDLSVGAVMPMPAPGTRVAITIEPRGGSAHPTTKPIVAMDPSSI